MWQFLSFRIAVGVVTSYNVAKDIPCGGFAAVIEFEFTEIKGILMGT